MRTPEQMTELAAALRAQGLLVRETRMQVVDDAGVFRWMHELRIETSPASCTGCVLRDNGPEGEIDAAKFAASLRATEKRAARAKAANAYHTRFLPR